MTTPVSPLFSPVALKGSFNASRVALPERLELPRRYRETLGEQTIRGLPFLFGEPGGPDVVLLDSDPVAIDLGGSEATYVVFVHAVEDATDMGRVAYASDEAQGYRLGGTVSQYELEYEDGSTAAAPILRRFAIQQGRYSWGSAPFACVPALDDHVAPAAEEALALGRRLPAASYALAPVRTAHAQGAGLDRSEPGLLWLYALPNPRPDTPLRRIVCRPCEERSALYAVTLGRTAEHPLRPGVRRKLRLTLPDGMRLNAIGEVDEADIGVDLGLVISARAALDYDHSRWRSEETAVEPSRSEREVLVELAAHPEARLHVGAAVYDLAAGGNETLVSLPPERPVTLRFVDDETRSGVAVRLHLHGALGQYLPPRGHHRRVNRVWSRDDGAEFASVENQYAYVDGECVADLPLGTVYVEISRGFEIAPIRTAVEVGSDTDELVFTLERILRWRERGWVTADTHVHFLSPQTALLEGRAEGVNVVNLLASQWGELFSNVGDFDGTTTFGASGDGRGEFLVRVGSENRMPILGHISLLGYGEKLIHPLCTSGPAESAYGDPLEVTMAEWAQRCIDQGGIVVMPHAPVPQLERAADIVLGLVHAIELMHPNPLRDGLAGTDVPPLNPYGVADWYRYLNLGHHIPLVAGSDKMSAEGLLGGIRTYAHVGDRELTYEGWMEAVRAGNTFVTVGPLVTMAVEGVAPGGVVRLPPRGGTVQVEWQVESLRVPIERVEIVAGGLVADDCGAGGGLRAGGQSSVDVTRSTWIALRVRGSNRARPDDLAAHTSAVQVRVEGSELFSETDATAILDQIQGAIAYVDTIAPRAEARRFRELRATLEAAYDRLHHRMHAAGVYHRHPLHDPSQPHEH